MKTICKPRIDSFCAVITGRPEKGSPEEGKSFIRGLCEVCGRNKQKSRGRNKQGRRRYARRCLSCSGFLNSTQKRVLKLKRNICEECHFVPVHSQQLVLHHIDKNRKNNHPSNFATLCANCHTLHHLGNWVIRRRKEIA